MRCVFEAALPTSAFPSKRSLPDFNRAEQAVAISYSQPHGRACLRDVPCFHGNVDRSSAA